jgi:protein phosphatase-4 regulatory subunit 3
MKFLTLDVISLDTLIVWTEPDGTDYALSFQDVEGCAEIWDFIIEVQRHFRGKSLEISRFNATCRLTWFSSYTDPSSPVASGSAGDSSEEKKLTVSSIIASGRLPDPAFGIISEIERAIKLIGRTPTGKDRICEYILTEVRCHRQSSHT